MKKLFMVLLLALCTTLVFAENRMHKCIRLNDNVKGWHTLYIEFTEDTYITEISTTVNDETPVFKVAFSNGYVEYFKYFSSIWDPDEIEWQVEYGQGYAYNELYFFYDPPKN